MGNLNINRKQQWKILDALIEKGIKQTGERLIEEEKRKNGYLIISDKSGQIKKIPAKDL